MRFCEYEECGQPLGSQMRADARYCSGRCRTRASAARRATGAHKPHAWTLSLAIAAPWSIIAFAVGIGLYFLS